MTDAHPIGPRDCRTWRGNPRFNGRRRVTGSKRYFWATHSRLQAMIDAAHTVKRLWDGILRWFDRKMANGVIEGINSLVQAAKAKARGYRSTRNLKAMVYLIAGKLDLRLPV